MADCRWQRLGCGWSLPRSPSLPPSIAGRMTAALGVHRAAHIYAKIFTNHAPKRDDCGPSGCRRPGLGTDTTNRRFAPLRKRSASLQSQYGYGRLTMAYARTERFFARHGIGACGSRVRELWLADFWRIVDLPALLQHVNVPHVRRARGTHEAPPACAAAPTPAAPTSRLRPHPRPVIGRGRLRARPPARRRV